MIAPAEGPGCEGVTVMDATRPAGSAISLGSNRVVLEVTEVEDAQVVRGVLERFARKHGASDERSRALVELANELSLDLVRESRGGRIEAERVGSFIEVRAVARVAEISPIARRRPTRELAPPSMDLHPGRAGDVESVSPSSSLSSWRLDLALANMDGAERTATDAEQLVLRAWCGLD